MKQKDLFVALSFAVFAIGLGSVIQETSYDVNAQMADKMAMMEPAAGEEELSIVDTTEPKKQEVSELSNTFNNNDVSTNDVKNIKQIIQPNTPAVTTDARKKNKLDIKQATTIREIGSPDAPIVIENFSALSCSHCSAFHLDVLPTLKRAFIDTGKVRFIFNPFPLNEPSILGAMIAQCVAPEKFERIVDLLFEKNSSWAYSKTPREALFNTVRLTGVSKELFDTCLDNEEMKKFIGESVRHGIEDYGVTATPTFVINYGEHTLRGNMGYKKLKQRLEAILASKAK